MNLNSIENCSIAIVGIGYVGLPLAIEFAKKKICKIKGNISERKVIGFDLNEKRIKELKNNIDLTNQLNNEEIKILKNISFTDNPDDITNSDVYNKRPTPINLQKILTLETLC